MGGAAQNRKFKGMVWGNGGEGLGLLFRRNGARYGMGSRAHGRLELLFEHEQET